MEELVAELGAAYTMGRLGFPYETQHASYLGSWLQALKADKYAIFTASRAAEDAADFLAGLEENTSQDDDSCEEAAE